jgi:phosphoenolpyruvate carboxykinase (GTP)
MNKAISAWVSSVAERVRPSAIHWCDGSAEEIDALLGRMTRDEALIRLNPDRYPRCFLHRSDPRDVAGSDHRTFISTVFREDVGPTNNWLSEADARRLLGQLFRGVMRGRTMYVVPYLLGPAGSRYSRVGVQITDSPYVVASLRLMTRMGSVALEHLGSSSDFVRGVHSVGDLSPDRRYVVHFPGLRAIWSIGSGYGGNALLSNKCHGLTIASVQAREEGWLAEHMLIMGLTDPEGVKHYLAAAFPSACGKTNLSMLVPTLPGWKVETVGDDICWMHVGKDGRLWALNPDHGVFGGAPGTSWKTNPAAMAAMAHDTIFTNVALRHDGTPWWEGMGEPPREGAVDWRGRPWTPDFAEPAAHPNARFTTSARQFPTVGPSLDEPEGVPISAIIFGGRRARVAPLVYEARSWEHGVYMGATLVSETTSAAKGPVAVPRHDPMAMLPYCGYNMAEYFRHWLTIGGVRKPRVFHVNWFRTGGDGRYLWPGYGENIRVMKWILDRVQRRAAARPTPIGLVPVDLDLHGLQLPHGAVEQLLDVDLAAWQEEARRTGDFLKSFGRRLPSRLREEHEDLLSRLRNAYN